LHAIGDSHYRNLYSIPKLNPIKSLAVFMGVPQALVQLYSHIEKRTQLFIKSNRQINPYGGDMFKIISKED